MENHSSYPLSFLSGFVQNRNTCRVIVQVDEIRKMGEPFSDIYIWTRADGKWKSIELDWTATRLWVLSEPKFQAFAMGPAGLVFVESLQGTAEEEIDSSQGGPTGSGDLRDLRFIGQHLYVVGMSRQVYRREGPNKWVPRDAGVVQPPGTLEVAGFNAIDGLSEDDIYAVGFNGEIWRYHEDNWRHIDSPTDIVLHRVRVIKPDLVFACGQMGVVLRGQGNTWEVIDHGITTQDLWGMEWFKGKLYVACDDGLFVLNDNDKLERVDIGLGDSWTCRHLHANDGVMWSFGPKHIAWTEDTKTWIDVTP